MRTVNWQFLLVATGVILVSLGISLFAGRSTPGQQADTPASKQWIGRDPILLDSTLLFLSASYEEIISVNLQSDAEKRVPIPGSGGMYARWSPNGAAVLTFGRDPDSPWQLTELSSGTATPLHPLVFSPTWSSDGDRIAYQYWDRETSTVRLTTAQPDGTNWQNVFTVPSATYPFERLWWSPLGTYMVGLDTATEPARYVRIFVSSKRIETLAEGAGSLRWSPSGKRALLDGAEGVLVADVTTGSVEPLGALSTVDWLLWSNEDTLLGIVTDQDSQSRVSSIKLADRSVQPLGEALASLPDRVLGRHDELLYVQTSSTITTLQIEK